MDERKAERVRLLMKHLVLASRGQRKIRQDMGLDEQIDVIRSRFLEGKISQEQMDLETSQIKSKLQKVIDMEAKLMIKQDEEKKDKKEIEDRLDTMSKKIDKYIEAQKKSRRIRELEKTLRAKDKKKREQEKMLNKVENKIDKIQEKIIDLKIMGRISPEKAREMRERIKRYKTKIHRLRDL